MNKYSNMGPAGYSYGQVVNLDEGMDMDEYGDYDYYDEDLDNSGDSDPNIHYLNQQQLLQQQILQAQAAGQLDSSEGYTDSLGVSAGVPGMEGYEFMEEELDDNYNPSMDEVEEYARFLGMNVDEDQDFFYIAKEGLKAPLPESWKPCKSPRGNVYYFNFSSKQLQKEHPCDDHYRKLDLEEKQSRRKKTGETYFQQQMKQQQEMEKAQKQIEFQQIQQQVMRGSLGNFYQP